MSSTTDLRQFFRVAILTLAILALVGLLLGLSGAAASALLADWWLLAVPVPLLLMGMHYRERLSPSLRDAWISLMLAMVILFAFLSLQIIISNISVKPEWDLKWFWLHGRAAALGMNFYQPELVHNLAAQYAPNTDLFMSQLYFWYPPPTMLLMLPLGWFEMETAFLWWQIVQLVLLVVDVAFLWKLFLPETGRIGLLFAAALIVALHPTIDTIYAGQTNFLLLLLLLLFWRDRHRPRAGLWLTIAVFVKPFVAVMLLWVVLRRQWKTLGMMLISGLVAALISMLVFGTATFFSFFTANPITNLSRYMYTMPFNQSLLATLLRATQADVNAITPFLYPPFLIAALVLTGITALCVYRVESNRDEWALAAVLVLGILIYPHVLRYYAVLLMLPVLLVWKEHSRFPGGLWGAAAFITFIFWWVAYRPGNLVFVSILASWLILIAGMRWQSIALTPWREPLKPSHLSHT
jgi:hypothetical protein